MNNKLVVFAIFTVIMAITSGCGRKNANSASWASVSREVDSINSELERSFADATPDSIKEMHIERLCSIAEYHPDNLCLQSRAHFWKGRHYNRIFRAADATRELELAKKFCDSTAYPYDAARIAHETTNNNTDVVSVYSSEIRLLDYFTQIGDSTMMAVVTLNLSNIFRNINDTVNYKRYLRQSQDLQEKTGNTTGKLICLINSTDLYGKEGADSILNIIRTTPGIERMHHLYYIALYNSFLYTDRVKYLENLLSMIRDDTTQRNGRWHVQALIALHDFKNKENIERAMKYSGESYEHLSDRLPLVMQSTIREAYAHNMMRTGHNDSAMTLMSDAKDLYVKYLEQHRSGEMLTREASAQIAREKEMFDKMRQLDRTRYFLIVGGIVLGSAVLVLILFLLLRNVRQRKNIVEEELTANRNHLAATQLVTTSKSQMIQSVADAVKEMKDSGSINAEAANGLLSSLHVHASAQDELESFAKIYENLHPRFAEALGERCPGIPESMIRLASYVAMGYTTQQISDMLGISYGSVNKNRYRLRTRLGLARGESLEHALRTLRPKEPDA